MVRNPHKPHSRQSTLRHIKLDPAGPAYVKTRTSFPDPLGYKTQVSSTSTSAALRGLHRFANPGQFLRFGAALQPWLNAAALIVLAAGLIWGLFFSPPDWQQKDAVRIMYIHVPAAWLASLGYAGIAAASVAGYVWRHPLADLAAVEIAPVGAVFTAICLMSGSLWGKPMWGTWWEWDARLTSVLVLFFLYLGHIALTRAFDDPERGYAAGRILALIGAINLPIIKYSVDWWNTLHQPASISLSGIHMAGSIFYPLITCTLGFNLAFAAIVLARLRAAVMEQRLRAQLLSREA